MEVKASTSVVALLGDVVDSRGSTDRAGLHRRLTLALEQADSVVPSNSGLLVTVGDEFQGTYDRLGDALDAALHLRMALGPEVDVRFGIGRGDAVELDAARGLQDGPAWWAAREAVEEVERASRGTALRQLRTAVRTTEPAGAAFRGDDAVNAALACRDQLIGVLPPRPRRIVAGLIAGLSQTDLASQEGVSPSAISQQVRSHGIGAILHAHELLKGLP